MDILDIFYDNIVKEAQKGRIDCFFYYNIIFSTYLVEDNIKYEADSSYSDLLIPTLCIKDKEKFDLLLVEYVNKCLEFYDDSNFASEVISGEYYDDDNKISKEKVILALLFANATIEDFADPIEFLRKRISFMENCQECKYNLGKSNILDCEIEIEICKDKINNETPYQFCVKCISDNFEEYEFPRLKFGLSDGKAYIFAIQNSTKNNGPLSKKINRKLYKVGEGFCSENDNYDLYEEGNLKDITPSFVIVANIFISYLENLGIYNFTVQSLLLERWNSKVIANHIKAERKGSYESFYDKQLEIQSNLTEKFLRTFLRLIFHCDNLSITAYPMEQGFDLHFVNDGIMRSNNSLLNETANMVNEVQMISSAESDLHK